MYKVLVVDDEATVRRGIASGVKWEKLGFAAALEAVNGEDGVARAEKEKPDLIITDIRMPKMDGIEMMNTLRARGCRAHVIVLTAYSDFEYAHSALRFGASDYLLKPFTDSELKRVITAIFPMAGGQAAEAKIKLRPIDASGKSRYVQEALRYIEQHYAEDISITAVADFLKMSEGHLSHLFKKETGTTVMAYLTQYRIHAAMELLNDCRVKVYEAAEKVGYKDVTYFGSTFKKLTGLSPSEYQNSVNP